MRDVRAEDWLIVVALIAQGVSSTLDVLAIRNGLGDHMYKLAPKQLFRLGQLTYVIQIIYIISLCLVKLSILSTYLSTFTFGRIRLFIKTAMAFIFATALAACLTIVFQCVPIRGDFFQSYYHIPGDRCIDGWALQYTLSSLVIFTDLVIFVLPIQKIWELSRLSWQKRVGIISLFSLGGLACIASAFRIYVLHKLHNSHDRSWITFQFSLCCSVEVALGTIAVSLPALKAFFTKSFAKSRGKSDLLDYGTQEPINKELSEYSQSQSSPRSDIENNFDRFCTVHVV